MRYYQCGSAHLLCARDAVDSGRAAAAVAATHGSPSAPAPRPTVWTLGEARSLFGAAYTAGDSHCRISFATDTAQTHLAFSTQHSPQLEESDDDKDEDGDSTAPVGHATCTTRSPAPERLVPSVPPSQSAWAWRHRQSASARECRRIKSSSNSKQKSATTSSSNSRWRMGSGHLWAAAAGPRDAIRVQEPAGISSTTFDKTGTLDTERSNTETAAHGRGGRQWAACSGSGSGATALCPRWAEGRADEWALRAAPLLPTHCSAKPTSQGSRALAVGCAAQGPEAPAPLGQLVPLRCSSGGAAALQQEHVDVGSRRVALQGAGDGGEGRGGGSAVSRRAQPTNTSGAAPSGAAGPGSGAGKDSGSGAGRGKGRAPASPPAPGPAALPARAVPPVVPALLVGDVFLACNTVAGLLHADEWDWAWDDEDQKKQQYGGGGRNKPANPKKQSHSSSGGGGGGAAAELPSHPQAPHPPRPQLDPSSELLLRMSSPVAGQRLLFVSKEGAEVVRRALLINRYEEIMEERRAREPQQQQHVDGPGESASTGAGSASGAGAWLESAGGLGAWPNPLQALSAWVGGLGAAAGRHTGSTTATAIAAGSGLAQEGKGRAEAPTRAVQAGVGWGVAAEGLPAPLRAALGSVGAEAAGGQQGWGWLAGLAALVGHKDGPPRPQLPAPPVSRALGLPDNVLPGEGGQGKGAGKGGKGGKGQGEGAGEVAAAEAGGGGGTAAEAEAATAKYSAEALMQELKRLEEERVIADAEALMRSAVSSALPGVPSTNSTSTSNTSRGTAATASSGSSSNSAGGGGGDGPLPPFSFSSYVARVPLDAAVKALLAPPPAAQPPDSSSSNSNSNSSSSPAVGASKQDAPSGGGSTTSATVEEGPQGSGDSGTVGAGGLQPGANPHPNPRGAPRRRIVLVPDAADVAAVAGSRQLDRAFGDTSTEEEGEDGQEEEEVGQGGGAIRDATSVAGRKPRVALNVYDTTSEHWVLDVVDEQQWDETDEQEELDEQPQPQLGGGGGGGGALPAERFIVGSSSGPSDELGGLLPAKARPAAAKGPTPDRAATTATSTAAAPPSSSPSLQRSPDTTSSSNGTPGPQATRSGSDSGDGSDTMDETEQEGAQQGGGRTPIFLLPGVTVSVRAADGTLLRLRPAFLSLQQLGGLVALCRDVAASAWRAQRSMERWRVVGALDVLAVHSAGFPVVRFPPLPGAGKGDKDSRDGGKDGKEKDNDDNGDDEEEDSLPEAKELLREMGMNPNRKAGGAASAQAQGSDAAAPLPLPRWLAAPLGLAATAAVGVVSFAAWSAASAMDLWDVAYCRTPWGLEAAGIPQHVNVTPTFLEGHLQHLALANAPAAAAATARAEAAAEAARQAAERKRRRKQQRLEQQRQQQEQLKRQQEEEQQQQQEQQEQDGGAAGWAEGGHSHGAHKEEPAGAGGHPLKQQGARSWAAGRGAGAAGHSDSGTGAHAHEPHGQSGQGAPMVPSAQGPTQHAGHAATPPSAAATGVAGAGSDGPAVAPPSHALTSGSVGSEGGGGVVPATGAAQPTASHPPAAAVAATADNTPSGPTTSGPSEGPGHGTTAVTTVAATQRHRQRSEAATAGGDGGGGAALLGLQPEAVAGMDILSRLVWAVLRSARNHVAELERNGGMSLSDAAATSLLLRGTAGGGVAGGGGGALAALLGGGGGGGLTLTANDDGELGLIARLDIKPIASGAAKAARVVGGGGGGSGAGVTKTAAAGGVGGAPEGGKPASEGTAGAEGGSTTAAAPAAAEAAAGAEGGVAGDQQQREQGDVAGEDKGTAESSGSSAGIDKPGPAAGEGVGEGGVKGGGVGGAKGGGGGEPMAVRDVGAEAGGAAGRRLEVVHSASALAGKVSRAHRFEVGLHLNLHKLLGDTPPDAPDALLPLQQPDAHLAPVTPVAPAAAAAAKAAAVARRERSMGVVAGGRLGRGGSRLSREVQAAAAVPEGYGVILMGDLGLDGGRGGEGEVGMRPPVLGTADLAGLLMAVEQGGSARGGGGGAGEVRRGQLAGAVGWEESGSDGGSEYGEDDDEEEEESEEGGSGGGKGGWGAGKRGWAAGGAGRRGGGWGTWGR